MSMRDVFRLRMLSSHKVLFPVRRTGRGSVCKQGICHLCSWHELLVTFVTVNNSCYQVDSLNHLIESNIEIGMEVILSKGT